MHSSHCGNAAAGRRALMSPPQAAIAGPWRRIAGFLRPTRPPPGMTTKQPKKADAYNPENPAYNKNTKKSSK